MVTVECLPFRREYKVNLHSDTFFMNSLSSDGTISDWTHFSSNFITILGKRKKKGKSKIIYAQI